MGEPAAVADRAWRFACPDWEERLRAGRSLVPDLPLDDELAAKAVGIFDNLRLPDVPSRPFLADAGGEWFRDIVRAAFGSLERDTGQRRIRKIFLEVPKKNSKTTNGAGLMLTALLMNERPRAEFFLVGPTQEIADLAFQQASGMIDADEEGYLQKRFLVQEHVKTIVDRLTKAKLKVKTFDTKVMTGGKPVMVLLDELHVMAEVSYAAKVMRQITGGLLPNPESLLVIITTQSDSPPAGVFKSELQYARGVRDGRILDGETLPVLYEFPEAMQTDEEKPWADPASWPMVLPNLGRSISIDRLLKDFREAAEKGDEDLRSWASQHLNVEIGLALHVNRWRGADYWEAAADRSLTLEALLERSEVAVVGADGGGLDDLFGLAVIGREKKTHRWLIWAHAWAHLDVLQRRKDIAERLRDFERDGDLTVCDHPNQDAEEAAELAAKVRDAGLLPDKLGVGLDPIGIADLVDALNEREISGDQLAAIPQGYKLSRAIWGLERKLAGEMALHCGSPLLAWCVGNAKTEQRGNAVLVTKEVAGKAKIDPLMAIYDAYELMSRNPQATRLDFDEMVLAGGGLR